MKTATRAAKYRRHLQALFSDTWYLFCITQISTALRLRYASSVKLGESHVSRGLRFGTPGVGQRHTLKSETKPQASAAGRSRSADVTAVDLTLVMCSWGRTASSQLSQ